jgi:hypothetical protein
MSDWKRVSDEDAAKIRSGGAWAYRDGKLISISTEAIFEQLREEVPKRFRKLAEQLGADASTAFDGLTEASVSDDFRTVTLTMRVNGVEATDTWPLAARVS